MSIGGTMTVWAEPIKRGDFQLVAGDVKEATAWFLARKRLADIFRLSVFTIRMAILKLCASAKQIENCLKILLGNIRRR